MDYRPYSYNPYGNELTNAWPMMISGSWYSSASLVNSCASMNTEASILQQQMNVCNQVNSCMAYPRSAGVETLEDLYRIAFPYDPIYEWGKKRAEEIGRKYAWLEDKGESVLRTNAPSPMTVTLKG